MATSSQVVVIISNQAKGCVTTCVLDFFLFFNFCFFSPLPDEDQLNDIQVHSAAKMIEL